MDSWIETAIGKMHMNKITQRDLARKLNWSPQYLCNMLGGKRKSKSGEERILGAINEIIAERNN